MRSFIKAAVAVLVICSFTSISYAQDACMIQFEREYLSGLYWTVSPEKPLPVYLSSDAAPPLSDGAATETTLSSVKVDLDTILSRIPGALDGTGGLKVHEQGAATVVPELDASKVIQPISASIADSQTSSAISLGCTGSCRRVTFCNTGTVKPICVKFATGWTVAYPIPARAAASSALQCVSFQNVTTAYWNSTINANGVDCTGGTTTLVIPEDD